MTRYKYIKLKWKKIAPKNLIMFDRITLTISGTLIFLVWLMFLMQNFYPKSSGNFAAMIMSWPLQVSIWPMTLIILIILIMPIWVTQNFEVLAIFLFLSLIFILVSASFLVFLNVNEYWFLWLFAHILAGVNVVFVLFSVYYLSKKKKRNKIT